MGLRAWFKYRGLTAEERRLAEHDAMMSRVQGDIVIKPVPYPTHEELEDAAYQRYSCTAGCGADLYPMSFGVCYDCRIADMQFMNESEHYGSGLSLVKVETSIPMGAEADENGDWVFTGPRPLTGSERINEVRPSVVVATISDVAGLPSLTRAVS